MSKISSNSNGNCPYDNSSSFNTNMTETRRPGQQTMQCSQCLKWSVRQRGIQYPLQNPNNKLSPPTLVVNMD